MARAQALFVVVPMRDGAADLQSAAWFTVRKEAEAWRVKGRSHWRIYRVPADHEKAAAWSERELVSRGEGE